MEKIITKTGVVAVLDGKYYGVQYADGQCTSYGFGDIEKAIVSNPEYCKNPTDMTGRIDFDLQKSKLVTIEITTAYRVMEE